MKTKRMKRQLGPVAYHLVQANSLPVAYAVWTRAAKSYPWQFHTAYKTRNEASKASQELSYYYDTRITKEGYGS